MFSLSLSELISSSSSSSSCVKTHARFEDIQNMWQDSSSSCRTILINTLPLNSQDYLIKNTLDGNTEEKVMNDILDTNAQSNVLIIVYGKNCLDESALKKRHDIEKLGFKKVLVYTGGLFEWSLLQDIFGNEEFPTTRIENNILLYKP